MIVSRSFLQGYQWFAGLADAGTGVCLIVVPILTMRLLGIEIGEHQAPYLSYIGVFVLGIGLSYFLCGRLGDGEESCARWESTWRFTATCRSLVALFLFWKIGQGQFAFPWLIVALTDAALASFQWVGLHQGWLRREASS